MRPIPGPGTCARWGAAGRGCHTPTRPGSARFAAKFARSSYVHRASFGISTSAVACGSLASVARPACPSIMGTCVHLGGRWPVALAGRLLLLVACRSRARVIRACAVAVGIAKRGAQIRRLGASCKAGVRWCSLPHGRRCRHGDAPQFRAIGGPVGRAALRLETGRATRAATCRSRTAPAVREPRRMQTRSRPILTRMSIS